MRLNDPVSTDSLLYVRTIEMRYIAYCDNNCKNLSVYHTPVSPELIDAVCVPSYISGYVDGEGCFCVSLNQSSRHKFGWEVRPSFSISQNSDRSQVLRLCQKYFDCGTIRPDQKTLKYEVRSLTDLVNKVIPHFEVYPLISGKYQDFLTFRSICQTMSNEEHLTKNGLREIFRMIEGMNLSGKRKFIPREIKI